MKRIHSTDPLNLVNQEIILPIDADIIGFDNWVGGYDTKLFSITYTSDMDIKEFRKWYIIATNVGGLIDDDFLLLTTLTYTTHGQDTRRFLFYKKEITKQEIRDIKIDSIL